MKKLKVLIVTSKFPRFEGDPQPPFTYDFARHLAKLNCEVHIVAPHDSHAKKREVFHGMHVYRFKYFLPEKLQRVAYGPGIPDNLKNSFLAKIQILPFVLSQIITTLKIINRVKPNIVHVHWAFPQGLGVLFSNTPYIVTIYGGEVFMAKKFHLVSLLNTILKKSCKSFSITKGLRNEMKKAGIYSNVGVIPLGVDVDVFKPKTPGYLRLRARLCKKDEKLIISVGRLVEKKGHKYLITAFFHLSKKMNKIKLVIVGDGPLFKQLKDQVHALKIEKKVIFAKEINHKELPKYYSAADLFVLPSVIDGVGNMETQGVVFLEAMASKCPVIGTNTGGIPDVIDNGKTGLLVSPRNDSELEKAMHTILLDEEFRNNLVANAYRKIYSTFLWSKIAKQYVKYYKSVCNNQ